MHSSVMMNSVEHGMLLFGDISLFNFLAIGLVMLFGMGFHEYAHAMVADYWGDPTPRRMGRLTPNPFVHINWLGWAMWALIGFGILGSVPINRYQMRDPKWGSFWTSFAGPLSNLGQGLIYAIVLRLLGLFTPVNAMLGWEIMATPTEVGQGVNPLVDFISLLFFVGVLFNVLMFAFNLLPLFPFDGWTMMWALLPDRGVEWKNVPVFIRQSLRPLANFLNRPVATWEQWAQITQFIFMALFMISFVLPNVNIFWYLYGRPAWAITRFLLGV
jgi:Zn-dependent protease